MSTSTALSRTPERAPVQEPARKKLPSLLRHPMFWTGVVILTGLVLFSFVGPWFWPRNPLAIHVAWFFSPPRPGLPLGADDLGRDELARLMVGGQLIIIVSFTAAILASILGAGAGLVAGIRGGRADRLIMWVADVFLGVPQLVPLLLIDVLLSPSATTMTVLVALTGWPTIARLVRAETLSIRERDFVQAAWAAGAREGRVLGRYLLPNLMGPVLVAASFQVGTAMLVVATASYLGVGLDPPWPDWGTMMSNGVNALVAGQWWMVVPPAVAYALLQISVNLVADALRESLGGARGGN
jgi:peptide/nickel transport system permease protein